MKKSNVTCGKREKVEMLRRRPDYDIRFTEACQFGPYTQVRADLLTKEGKLKMKGWGQSKCSPLDRWNREVGEAVAKARALTAIVIKMKGRSPHHPLMA